MAITEKSIKLLWSGAGGRCSFPDCWTRLTSSDVGTVAPYTIGQMAHICGERPGANRHDPQQTATERDSYANLILLCPAHHALIDRPENKDVYPVGCLHEIKRVHEDRVLNIMEAAGPRTQEAISRQVMVLLTENHTVWEQFGPQSTNARREPHNEQLHAIWLDERLSTIVPNNRKITELILMSQDNFDANDQEAISAFLLHARTYEQWVNDEIPYNAVLRFPQSFEALIKRVCNASAK